MKTIVVEMTVLQARSLIAIIEHVYGQANGTAASVYGIDELCRKDCKARWWELRTTINAQLEVKVDPKK